MKGKYYDNRRVSDCSDFGKTVFVHLEAAERKLETVLEGPKF